MPSHIHTHTLPSVQDKSINTTCQSQSQPQLQLSVNDLLYPNKTAEVLLDKLTPEQLSAIEQALYKLKEKKQYNRTESLPIPTAVPPVPIAPTEAAETAKTFLSNQNDTSTLPRLALFEDTSQPYATSIIDPLTSLSTATAAAATSNWVSTATQVAEALAEAISSQPQNLSTLCPEVLKVSEAKPLYSASGSQEPATEVREGVEWVSFVYSHLRTLRRYCIRTDLGSVNMSLFDEKFKKDNCIYPRANLSREAYQGNRWNYETECNELGWRLAWLNQNEIAGKRGLIQRAVDSYRNRYPSMRSRRVARQEKLLRGTLRKRKHREYEDESPTHSRASTPLTEDRWPKTMLIEDELLWRLKIDIDSVPLATIDMTFRKNNCVFPRALHMTSTSPCISDRQRDEAKCNEIGWQLAWLNPRQLANKKSLLQHVLDLFRNQHTPHLRPRKYSSRISPIGSPFSLPHQPPSPHISEILSNTSFITHTTSTSTSISHASDTSRNMSISASPDTPPAPDDDAHSFYSGTTATLDFHDCFSPSGQASSLHSSPAEQMKSEFNVFGNVLATLPCHTSGSLSLVSDDLSEKTVCDASTALPSVTGLALTLEAMYQHAMMVHSTGSLFSDLAYCGPKYENISTEMDDFEANPLISQLFKHPA